MKVRINNHGNQNINIDGKTSNINIAPRFTEKIDVNISPLEPVKLSLREANTSRVDISAPISVIAGDYNALTGLPSINGVTVKGALTYIDLFLAKSSINAKEYWDVHPTYIPERGEIVVYQNKTIIDNVSYPGIKIGDGNAYLIDLPFVGDDLCDQIMNVISDHINNTDIHVTTEEKNFWNNKLNCEVSSETLVLNKQ